jgi:hypothetical protein
MTAYPSLDDLTWLFEDAPTMEFDDTGYPGCAATWRAVRDGVEVVCTIAPLEQSVQITCTSGGAGLVTDVHLLRVVDSVSIDRAHGAEALTITCRDVGRLGPLRLRLRPRVELHAAT